MELKEIGERIRWLRTNKLKISQEKLACKVGLDRTYISKVESGKKNLTLETFNKFCDALGVSLKEFVEFEIKDDESNEKY